jgi:hypothetical protein
MKERHFFDFIKNKEEGEWLMKLTVRLNWIFERCNRDVEMIQKKKWKETEITLTGSD